MAGTSFHCSRALADDMVRSMRVTFQEDPKNDLAQNLGTRQKSLEMCFKRLAVEDYRPVFNYRTYAAAPKPLSDQGGSHLCWMHACLNAARIAFMKQHNLAEFEFSQAYLHFWERIERCNDTFERFLQLLKDGKGRPDNELYRFLLSEGVYEAGFYDLAANLIIKYGIIPKACFPSTPNLKNSRVMHSVMASKIRECYTTLQKLDKKELMDNEITDKLRREFLQEMYNLLSICIGTPPDVVTWEAYDKDMKCLKIGPVSPKQFYEDHVKPYYSVGSKVMICSDPRIQYPFNRKYFTHLPGMSGKRTLQFVNQPLSVLKDLAMKSIQNGEAVCIECECNFEWFKAHGIMDPNSCDYSALGISRVQMSRAESIAMKDVSTKHSVVIIAVHIEDGKTIRWQVEDSYGDNGTGGHHVMSDDWFSSYVLGMSIDKSYLPSEILAINEQDPIEIPIFESIHP